MSILGVQQQHIFLQPVDGSWAMGEPYILEISPDVTVTALLRTVEELKGIPACRQQVRLPNRKLVPKAREVWPLKRHGITNGTKIFIEPTRPGGWLWNPLEYYEEKLLGEVIDILFQASEPLPLEEVTKRVNCPPCIKMSLRTFLRKYPERVRMRTDITTDRIWLCLTVGVQLPTFENVSITLGNAISFDPEEFTWENFSDVDSMKPLLSSAKAPDVFMDVSIFNCVNVGTTGDIFTTNPFAVIIWNGNFIGFSPPKLWTRNPIWNNARFQVPVPFDSDPGRNHLEIEIWNFDYKNKSFLRVQSVAIEGEELQAFLDLESTRLRPFKTFSLVSAVEQSKFEMKATHFEFNSSFINETSTSIDVGSKEINFESNLMPPGFEKSKFPQHYECLCKTSLAGKTLILGSKAYYQLKVKGVYELFSYQFENTEEVNPFVIVVWNDLDIGQTPFRKNTRWASWEDEVFNIPVPANMEIYACNLTIQLWHRDDIGKGKQFLCDVVITGRILKDLLTKQAPFSNQAVFEFQLPDRRENLNDDIMSGGKKNKNKQIGGKVCLLAGPVGLQEKDLKRYEIVIKHGVSMARTEVLCIVYWNSVEIGRTDVARSFTEKQGSVKWFWTKNNFIIECQPEEKISKCELKIDCFDPSTKGMNSYIGCVLLTAEELTMFLDQPYVVLANHGLKKDPNKDDKSQRISKGTLQIRGGPFGGRMEAERLVEVLSCHGLSCTTTDSLCYCQISWNSLVIGKTKETLNDGHPAWSSHDSRWACIANVSTGGFQYGNCKLTIEVFEGRATDNASDQTFLGTATVSSHALQNFLESTNRVSMSVDLTEKDGLTKEKQKVQGKVILSTPGIQSKSILDTKVNDEEMLSSFKEATNHPPQNLPFHRLYRNSSLINFDQCKLDTSRSEDSHSENPLHIEERYEDENT